MVGVRASCFGLLLFLWLSFGGPAPLKPKGYRFQVAFPEAPQLASKRMSASPASASARCARRSATPEGNRTLATIEIDAASRRCAGRAGDPAPEDPPRRDLRRADAGRR